MKFVRLTSGTGGFGFGGTGVFNTVGKPSGMKL